MTFLLKHVFTQNVFISSAVLISVPPPCCTLPPSTLQFALHSRMELCTPCATLFSKSTSHFTLQCGRRDEVTMVTGYLRSGRGDPEALLLPLSQLDPESRGQKGLDLVHHKLPLNAIQRAGISAVKWALKCYCEHVCVHACVCVYICMCMCVWRA